MSSPGEIKAEFDTFYQKIEGEKLAQQEKENKLSEEFIKELEVRINISHSDVKSSLNSVSLVGTVLLSQEEERKLKLEQEELLKYDEVIARELASEMDADEVIFIYILFFLIIIV